MSINQLPSWCPTVDLNAVWSGECGVSITLDVAGVEHRHRCGLKAGHDRAHSCSCGCEWKHQSPDGTMAKC
jgi:hypothetical protein